MDELNEILQQLVVEACSWPLGSDGRNQNLERIIEELKRSRRLRRGSSVPEADYDDILQKTWIYLCRNLCEAETAKKPYNPNRSTLLTWINAYISWRLLDYYLEIEREKAGRMSPIKTTDGEILDPVDIIPARPEPPPILEKVLAWLEQEKKVLRRIYVEGRTDIHCELLIRHRLPPETSWQQLAQELGVSENTLQGFYRRKCVPRLREAGRQLSYLE